MRLFHSNIDWIRVLVIVSAATAAWTSLANVIPHKYHLWVESVLGAITIFITTMIRPNKWQQRAEEQPVSVMLNTTTGDIKATSVPESEPNAPPADQ